jgi:hypothetical protein
MQQINGPPTWAYRKCDLPVAADDESFIVSCDTKKVGAKKFCRFATPADGLGFLEANRGGPYYEVLEDVNLPCKLYLDVDRPDKLYKCSDVAVETIDAVYTYFEKVLRVKLNLQMGRNVNVSKAPTDKKTSVHVVFSIKMPSVAAHRAFTRALVAFVLQKPHCWPELVADDKCVIDEAVYTQFRSYRATFMVKKGRDNPLTPFSGSSMEMKDHLVGYYPSLDPADMQEMPPPIDQDTALMKQCEGSLRAKVAKTSMPLARSKFPIFENSLNKWDSILEALGEIRIADIREQVHGFRIRLDKQTGTVCPYAGRCHANNNLYLSLSKDKRKAEVICYDNDCMDHIEATGHMLLSDNDWGSNSHYDAVMAPAGGMHSQARNIHWNEDYDEPQMRPLPTAPIVCVLGGMGVGKTIAIKDVLKENCTPTTKALVVTHSRSLAVKLHADFAPLGFINYQEQTGQMQDCKIVVCLDSLYRVVTRNFDIIVIDEAVSVFLHFNSSKMIKRAENSALLEFLLLSSRTTYLLDATLDITFIKNIVDYFSVQKSVDAYWIRNQYKRPTNRTASLTTCTGPLGGIVGEASLIFSAATKVLDLLNVGQKVVCCSSTRAFTETLATFINERRGETVIKVYNGNQPASDLQHVERDWFKYDLLIYSPSITSGVSFEGQHYDSLVAYLVNSPFTPGVESSLQQLMRVRQLRTGEMHMYVHDTMPQCMKPVSVEEITTLLSDDISLVARHFANNQLSFFSQIKVSGEKLQYDQDRLSWHILVGIVQTQNLSACHYIDVLAMTLKLDYNIPLKLSDDGPALHGRDMDLVVLQMSARMRAIPAFESIVRLTQGEYQVLKEAQGELTPEDRAAIRLFDCEHAVWGVNPDLVDEAFYKTLVMAAGAFDYYFRVKRFLSMTHFTLDENRNALQLKVLEILHLDDKNLELFKTKAKTHHCMLVSAHALILQLCDFKQQDDIRRLEPVYLHVDTIQASVDKCLAGLEPQERFGFKKLFKVKQSSTAVDVLQSVVKMAFGMRLSRQDTHMKRANFSVYVLDNNKLKGFTKKYRPSFPMSGIDALLVQ